MRRPRWTFVIALVLVFAAEAVVAGDEPLWVTRGPGGYWGIGRISGKTILYLGPTDLIIALTPKTFVGVTCGAFVLLVGLVVFRELTRRRAKSQ